MAYFSFLAVFIGIPLALMALLTWRDRRNGKALPPSLSQLPGWLLIVAHVIAAVIWTTPWDNYLVATGVWYYNPALVSGVTLGWVPIEEYAFFVVQTVLTGLWLLWLGRRVRPAAWPIAPRPRLNRIAAGVTAALWLAAVLLFVSGWPPGTYLALEVGWLLFPVIPQMLLGAHVLWQQRRLVLAALLAPWLYLCAADFVAIGSGTWTIAPAQSTGVMIGGVLPLEEAIFFLLTNMLIVFGMVLFLGTDNETIKAFVARRITRKPQAAPSA
jgi:lycopene beta-cyclase